MTRRLRAALPGEGGITMIEVVVALSIMSVVMAMFTGGVIAMFRVANKNDSLAGLQSQLNIVFVHLDKEIRYAQAISAPGTVGSDYYVEYLTGTGAGATCVELRLDVTDAQLQRRSWPQGSTTVDAPGWVPPASNVTATNPFILTTPSGATLVQRLRVRLRISGGGTDPNAASYSSRRNEYVFSALNTNTATPTTYCLEGRTLP
jgi:hypothetical protein